MSKKVLILSGSPRKGGNSDILCDEFARGATEAGHEVEKSVSRKKRSATAVPATLAVAQVCALSRTI